jgi:hypothetical protein
MEVVGGKVGCEISMASTSQRPPALLADKMSTRAPPAHVEDADKVALAVQSQAVDMSRRCKQLRSFRDKPLGVELGMDKPGWSKFKLRTDPIAQAWQAYPRSRSAIQGRKEGRC